VTQMYKAILCQKLCLTLKLTGTQVDLSLPDERRHHFRW